MVKKISSLLFIFLTIILIAIDQLTKLLARSYLAHPIPLIKNLFQLAFAKNTGIAFGFFEGANSIIVWLYLVVLGLIIFFYGRFPNERFSRIMLAFIIAGVIGNFIDRIVFGYVTDFLDFRIWPVFNIADIYLCAGVVGIIAKEILRKEAS